jgi:hypothetical protein
MWFDSYWRMKKNVAARTRHSSPDESARIPIARCAHDEAPIDIAAMLQTRETIASEYGDRPRER